MIRRELDELMLDETCSAAAVEHLQRVCRRAVSFSRSRRSCDRSSAVSAPSPRRRILIFVCARVSRANRASTAFHLKSAYWPFARRGFAVAVLLLVFATGECVGPKCYESGQAM